MSEAHAPAAWWEDVEHLREAAERRIAERERAQREGRDPVALTPLRPLHDSERFAGPAVATAPAPRPLQPAPRSTGTGRFRRHRGASAEGSPAPRSAAQAAAATATALAVELDIEHVPDTWAPADDAPRDADLGTAALDSAAAAPARRREEPSTHDDRPTRREELTRLAQEQARAGTVSRPHGEASTRPARAGAPAASRRTIEIRGHAEPRPMIAAVPDPLDDPYRRRVRRPRRSPAEAFIAQPDRVALWAFLLGLFLIVVALASAH